MRTCKSLFSLLLLFASPWVWADPGLLLFPALGQPSSLTVEGRVLKDMPSAGSSTLSRNVRQLAVNPLPGVDVDVAFQGQHLKVRSGREGEFEVTFRAPVGQPFLPGRHPVEARASFGRAVAGTQIVSPEAPYFVISDFDDTVAVSNVLHPEKLVETVLLKDADTQPVVPGMAGFYQCLLQDKASAPGLAVVSGSPWQYVPRTGLFLSDHGFPFAGLYLRTLGPKTLSGYKQPILRKLLTRLSNKVILVGDSGEKDPEVYAQIRQEFPDRVLEIYIRKVRPSEPVARTAGMTVFTEAKQAAVHAQGKGYLSQACLDAAFGEGK